MKIFNSYSISLIGRRNNPAPVFCSESIFLLLTLGLLQLNVDIFCPGCLVYQRELAGRSAEWFKPEKGLGRQGTLPVGHSCVKRLIYLRCPSSGWLVSLSSSRQCRCGLLCPRTVLQCHQVAWTGSTAHDYSQAQMAITRLAPGFVSFLTSTI